MANVFSGFSDLPETTDPSTMLQNLGQILLLMQGASQNKPLDTLSVLNQMQLTRAKVDDYRRQQQAARQQAAFRQQAAGMFRGGLGPGQLGPPKPFNVQEFMANAAQDPELMKMLTPQSVQLMQQGGQLPNFGALQAETARSQAQAMQNFPKAPPGYFQNVSGGPEGVKFERKQPETTAGIRALGVHAQGGSPQEQIDLSKQADVTLPNITETRKSFVDLQGQRAHVANERWGGPPVNTMVQMMAGSMSAANAKARNANDPQAIKRAEDAQQAFDDLMGQSKDPKKDITLMLQDFMLAEQMQTLEDKMASPAMENRPRKIIGLEYEPFKANAEARAQEIRTAFHAAHGRDPSKDELRMLWIADLLEKSGASKWLTPTQ